jgi:hypothetical protein
MVLTIEKASDIGFFKILGVLNGVKEATSG